MNVLWSVHHQVLSWSVDAIFTDVEIDAVALQNDVRGVGTASLTAIREEAQVGAITASAKEGALDHHSFVGDAVAQASCHWLSLFIISTRLTESNITSAAFILLSITAFFEFEASPTSVRSFLSLVRVERTRGMNFRVHDYVFVCILFTCAYMSLELLHSKLFLAVRTLRFGPFEQPSAEIRRDESCLPRTSEWALIVGNLQSADFAYWSLTALQHVESTGEWHLEAHHT